MDLIQHFGSFRFLFCVATPRPAGRRQKAKGMLPNGNARPVPQRQSPGPNRCHQKASRRRRSQSQKRAQTHRAESGQTAAASTRPELTFIAAASKTCFVKASE
jgi:hypothetical protein